LENEILLFFSYLFKITINDGEGSIFSRHGRKK